MDRTDTERETAAEKDCNYLQPRHYGIISSPNGGHAIGGLCGYSGTHSAPNVTMEGCTITSVEADMLIDGEAAEVGTTDRMYESADQYEDGVRTQ